jgi:uncharacterized membrane-anchored protein
MSKIPSLSSSQSDRMAELKASLTSAMADLGVAASDFGSANAEQRNALWPAFWHSAQAAYKARLAVTKHATEQALG